LTPSEFEEQWLKEQACLAQNNGQSLGG